MTKIKTHITLLILVVTTLAFSIYQNESISISKNELDPDKILKIVNKYRKQGCMCGNEWMPKAAPVIWNKQLELASLKHSAYQSKINKLTHKGESNSSFNASSYT